MVKKKAAKKALKKSSRLKKPTKTSDLLIKKVEGSLKRKRQELIDINNQHRKIAGEFVELWVKVRRLKKQDVSLPTLQKLYMKDGI
jgi:hypothetical protein